MKANNTKALDHDSTIGKRSEDKYKYKITPDRKKYKTNTCITYHPRPQIQQPLYLLLFKNMSYNPLASSIDRYCQLQIKLKDILKAKQKTI